MIRWAFIPLILVIDRASKIWALTRLEQSQSLPVWPGVFHLTLVKNTGSAFGLWKDFPFIPVAVTLLALCVIFIHLVRARPSKNFTGWALVLGGALGNLYDRLVFGYVVDFLDFRVWPVFNIADACICAGIFLILRNSSGKHAPDSV